MFSFFLPWELLSESGPSAWLRRGPLTWREAEKRLGELKRPRCWVTGKTQDSLGGTRSCSGAARPQSQGAGRVKKLHFPSPGCPRRGPRKPSGYGRPLPLCLGPVCGANWTCDQTGVDASSDTRSGSLTPVSAPLSKQSHQNTREWTMVF